MTTIDHLICEGLYCEVQIFHAALAAGIITPICYGIDFPHSKDMQLLPVKPKPIVIRKSQFLIACQRVKRNRNTYSPILNQFIHKRRAKKYLKKNTEN
jgi:hypothetical protein